MERNLGLTLHCINDLLYDVETKANYNDFRRMLLYQDLFMLELEDEETEYVENRNRAFEALLNFIKILSKRRKCCNCEYLD